MKKTLTTAIVASFIAGAASAATLQTINIGNLAVEPSDGGANVIADVTTAGTVKKIEFLLAVNHFPISWGIETLVAITAPDGSKFAFSGTDFGWGAGPGFFLTGASFDIAPTSALGTWSVNLNDSFNDFTDPDYVTAIGSTIALKGDAIAPVPLPASALLLLGGLAGLGVARKRRKAA